jgi:hypothetical protein
VGNLPTESYCKSEGRRVEEERFAGEKVRLTLGDFPASYFIP